MQLLPPLNNASRIASAFNLDHGGKELGVIMKGGDDERTIGMMGEKRGWNS
jgi:hypothetical protein